MGLFLGVLPQSLHPSHGSLKLKNPQTKQFDVLLEEHQRLYQMTANLINVYSADDIHLNKTDYPLQKIEKAIEEEWTYKFSTKEINFKIDLPKEPTLFIDPGYMKLVWDNLLSNALEHTQKKEALLFFIKKLRNNAPFTSKIQEKKSRKRLKKNFSKNIWTLKSKARILKA